jgi:hypothetical protein
MAILAHGLCPDLNDTKTRTFSWFCKGPFFLSLTKARPWKVLRKTVVCSRFLYANPGCGHSRSIIVATEDTVKRIHLNEDRITMSVLEIKCQRLIGTAEEDSLFNLGKECML